MVLTVLRNLISNSVKYTKENGVIEIMATPYAKNVSFIQVMVQDSGIGISEDKQDYLFSIAHVESTKGTLGEPRTGLGLNICNDFVKKHGGKIWVKSIPGKESTFNFLLLT